MRDKSWQLRASQQQGISAIVVVFVAAVAIMDAEYIIEREDPTKGVYTNSTWRAASIATNLAPTGIPCVLWGGALLGLYGVPMESKDVCMIRTLSFKKFLLIIAQFIHLILPDSRFEEAVAYLGSEPGVYVCPKEDCCYFDVPEPSFTLHYERPLYEGSGTIKGLICLYKQSETLWFLPPIEETLGPCQYQADRKLPDEFVRTSDTEVLPPFGWKPGSDWLLCGRVPAPDGHLAVAPQAHVMVEAFMRVCLRADDVPSKEWPYEGGHGNGTHALNSIVKHIKNTQYLDEKKLSPVIKRCWDKYSVPRLGCPRHEWLDYTRKEFGLRPWDRHFVPEWLRGVMRPPDDEVVEGCGDSATNGALE